MAKVKETTSLEEIKQLIVDLSREFYAFKTEVRRDIASLKNDVAGLKNDVAGLKKDMREVKAGLHRLDRRVANLLELFLGVPEFSFNGYNFKLIGQNEVFIDSKNSSKTLGEIDVIYADKKNKALAFLEVKSYINEQRVKEAKPKAKRLAVLYKSKYPEFSDYDVYFLFAGYKAEAPAIEQMKEFGFGLLILRDSRSNIELKLEPSKKF